MNLENAASAVLGAVVAGGIGTYTAVRIDRLAARRERGRREDRELAVARLVSAELLVAHQASENALSTGRWPLWRQPFTGEVWKRHADVLASRLPLETFSELTTTYALLDEWQNRVAQYLAQFPATAQMNLGGEGPDERESTVQLDRLRQSLEGSHRDIQAIAYPGP